MAVCKNFRAIVNNFKKQYFPVIIWNKKHFWMQVAPIKCTLEKRFFAVANFEGLWVVSFQTVKKLWSL